MGNKLTKAQILYWFLGITFLMTGGSIASWKGINFYLQKRLEDSHYFITSVIQTGPEKEALKTRYLCELLSLSIDHPQNLYGFDVKEGEKKLLSSPLIKEAHLKKIFPSSLYVDYTVRTPIGYLADFENLLVDEDGYVFPASPFLSSKEMVNIYLGIFSCEKIEFGKPIQDKTFTLASTVLKCLKEMQKKTSFLIKSIDVSNAYASQYGRREIVVLIEHTPIFEHKDQKVVATVPHYLRLGTNDYKDQLGNYLGLLQEMLTSYQKQISAKETTPTALNFSCKTIDLRILKLAFIDQNN
jgi:hypothetical protein